MFRLRLKLNRCQPQSMICLRPLSAPPSRSTARLGRDCWNPLTTSVSHEFSLRKIPFERQKPLHVNYKGVLLDCGYRLDFLVAGLVVVEVKAIESLLPIHQAQVLSYLKLGGWKLGLLINFHAPLLRDGIKRVVLGLEDTSTSAARSG